MSDTTNSGPSKHQENTALWKDLVLQYQKPCFWKATWQLVNTVGTYLLLWLVMYLTLGVSWWLTIPLAVLAGLFMIRIFIIFHDCGHGSFYKSARANHILGFITGLLTFTPYRHWRWQHSVHHSNSGDLDKRGTGDVWTMTVQEYLEASRWKKFAYRLARNPVVLFVIAPLLLLLVLQRFPAAKSGRRERYSVYTMNLAVLAMVLVLGWIFGIKAYLLIQLTSVMVAGSAGVWLFYVQHQFEGVYWERESDWDYTMAALQGSSFYKLPRVLQWFTGNIGFHHIHHLSARIPNYNLEECHHAHPLFQNVKPVTLFSSLKSLSFRLWDEQGRQLVGYSHLRQIRKAGRPVSGA